MGMWQGLYQGYMDAQDARRLRQEREDRMTLLQEERDIREREREEDRNFQLRLLRERLLGESRANALDLLRERQGTIREQQQELRTAVSLGFDLPAAGALQRTGQLSRVINSVEERGLSREVIGGISGEVMRQLGELAENENVTAQTLLGVIESDTDFQNPDEVAASIVSSLYNAANVEDIESLYTDIARLGSSSSGGLAPFDISLSTENLDTTDLRRIRSAVLERLGSLFQPNQLAATNEGLVIVGNAPPELSRLVTTISDMAFNAQRSPGSGYQDATTAIQQLTDTVLNVRDSAPSIDVSDLARDFPSILEMGAEQYLSNLTSAPEVTVPQVAPTVQPAPQTGVQQTEELVDTITDRGNRRTRRDNTNTTPPTTQTGFGFDVEEEFR